MPSGPPFFLCGSSCVADDACRGRSSVLQCELAYQIPKLSELYTKRKELMKVGIFLL